MAQVLESFKNLLRLDWIGQNYLIVGCQGKVIRGEVVDGVESGNLERVSPLSVAARAFRIEGGDGEEDGAGVEGGEAEEGNLFATDVPGLTLEEEIARYKKPFLDRLYNLSAFVGEV